MKQGFESLNLMTRRSLPIDCRRFSDAVPVLRWKNGHLVQLRGAAPDGFRIVSNCGARPRHEFQLGGRHAGAYNHSSGQSPGECNIRVHVQLFFATGTI
jgi:hypothetical protein